MKSSNFFVRTVMFTKMLLLMAAVLFSVNGSVFAKATSSSMTIVDLPATGTDAAIGIDASKTYTHIFDFGASDVATINGVDLAPQFTENLTFFWEDVSPQGYGYIIDDSRGAVNIKCHEGNDDVVMLCDGNSVALFRDMIYYSRAHELGEGIIIELKDLVAGTQYSFRYYYRSWDPELPRPVTIKVDGPTDYVYVDSIGIDIDEYIGAHYLDYTYTADDEDKVIMFAFHDDGQGAHIYGISNEVTTGSAVESKIGSKPSTFELLQNYPNPFNPGTMIDFSVPKKSKVTLEIFDITGRKVATLIDEAKEAGNYSINFNGSNLSTGIYMYKLTAANNMLVRKMLLVK